MAELHRRSQVPRQARASMNMKPTTSRVLVEAGVVALVAMIGIVTVKAVAAKMVEFG